MCRLSGNSGSLDLLGPLGLSDDYFNHGRTMEQGASRPPFTAEARFQSQVSPWGICGGQTGTKAEFSLRLGLGFPVSIATSTIRILGVKNWKEVALNRDEWSKLLKKARAHQGLSSQ